MSCMEYDYIIVGAGFAGVVTANVLADAGNRILLVDKRKNIGGNMYDYEDKHGLIVHKYGPHILTLDKDSVYEYLSKYTEWTPVNTYLETFIDNKYVPLPINLNSIREILDLNEFEKVEKILLEYFNMNESVNIMDMMNMADPLIKKVAKEIFDKVFVGYNMKMWGLTPDKVDVDVLGRSPIKMSYDNKKFNCKYEVVPKSGYTSMFEKMVDNDNIVCELGRDATDIIKIIDESIYFNNIKYEGRVVYTAPIDELFEYKFGKLPYRALFFKKEIKYQDYYYDSVAVTFPMNYKKTRTSEMKRITGQTKDGYTVLISEYPGEYEKKSNKYNIPSYPILNDESVEKYKKYKSESKKIKNLFVTGRLGEFKYYNMEQTILAAFELCNTLLSLKECEQ